VKIRVTRIATVFFGAALMLSGCGGSQAPVDPYATAQIVVTGNGFAEAEPDLAVIIAGVDLSLKNPAEAVASAARSAEAVIAAARGMGIEDADMQTSSYNLWVEEEYDPYTYAYTGETVYHVQHYIRFDVRDLESVGAVLAAIVEAGGNSISSVSFTVEDQASLSDAAYDSAAEDAIARAQGLAEAMGVTLGEVRYISQYGTPYQVNEVSTVFRSSFDSAGEFSVPITSGTYKVTAQLSVTYAIEGRT